MASMISATTNPSGRQTYDTPGSFNFVVPEGIITLKIACIAGGGGGGGGTSSTSVGSREQAGGGGGAGGLSYDNTISVTPGETLTVAVGSGGAGGAQQASGGNGGVSSVSRGGTALISATGGTGGFGGTSSTSGTTTSRRGGPGGTGVQEGTSVTSGRGGHGGNGVDNFGSGNQGQFPHAGAGGGVAGYYGSVTPDARAGEGGGFTYNGNIFSPTTSVTGISSSIDGEQGGGAGGEINFAPNSVTLNRVAGAGGGVGIWGRGANGSGVTFSPTGQTGEDGGDGSPAPGGATSATGSYGGGGGGGTGTTGANGTGGAVHIMWGPTRSWPVNVLQDLNNGICKRYITSWIG